MLDVKDLNIEFHDHLVPETVVHQVSFHMDAGEIVGLVGESGSGKSMTALAIAGLLSRHDMKKTGEILFEGTDLLHCERSFLRELQGNDISVVFQEPMTSLNPVYTVGTQISEMITAHEKVSKKEVRERAIEMLRLVGIPSPEKRVDEYPHELSGGMRQRVMIAMALSCNPELLIADEPTTALDVTIQAQILDLMRKLQKKLNTSIMMITHDLGVIAEMADYVLVMYAGRVMEYCDVHSLFKDPLHPYTQGLISALPNINDQKDRLYVIKGNVPSLYDMPAGCGFWPRCPYATERCKTEVPDLYQIGDRKVRCFLHENRKQVV